MNIDNYLGLVQVLSVLFGFVAAVVWCISFDDYSMAGTYAQISRGKVSERKIKSRSSKGLRISGFIFCMCFFAFFAICGYAKIQGG